MEEIVEREIATLKRMVLRWKRNYIQWASPDGGNEFLIEEFSEEISRHVTPFVQRLYACKHLDMGEANKFLKFCSLQIEDLRGLLTNKGEDE